MSQANTNAISLKFLARNIRQAIFIYDVESNQFTFLSPAFEQVFKMTKESAIDACALLHMVHSEDRDYVTI
jgi:PAS domain-containing protein